MAILRGSFDLAIVGGGIIGLACARQVALKHPKLKICVIEKDKELATHQSMRNSGVVHRGLYYKKNSLKSKLCIKGADLVKDYCLSRNLPYKECGKLIVATEDYELKNLREIFENSRSNGIEGVELIPPDRIQKIQPGCNKALEAVWSPRTAIVDWRQVALSYADEFQKMGGTIFTEFAVCDFFKTPKTITVAETLLGEPTQQIEARSVICAAGLFSDRLPPRTGNNKNPRVVPFRGHYYLLSDRLAQTIKTNIYPVPDSAFPFLGVHLTPRIDGSVLVGPTALLSLGYEKYSDDDRTGFRQPFDILFRTGLKKLFMKPSFVMAGLSEIWRLTSKESFIKDVQPLLPDAKPDDLIETKFAGNRAQAVHADGTMVDDFIFELGLNPDFSKVLHLRNCPSPAATSSLAIAERVLDIVETRLI